MIAVEGHILNLIADLRMLFVMVEEKKGYLVYSTWGQAQKGRAHHGDFTSKNVELEWKLIRVLL